MAGSGREAEQPLKHCSFETDSPDGTSPSGALFSNGWRLTLTHVLAREPLAPMGQTLRRPGSGSFSFRISELHISGNFRPPDGGYSESSSQRRPQLCYDLAVVPFSIIRFLAGQKMNFALRSILSMMLIGGGALCADDTVVGKVTKIIDGDSILVTDEKDVEYEVQLEGIDAPELKQDFGKESTEGLSKLLKDKSVKLTWASKDNFDRLLAQVYVDQLHINAEMLKNGMAWHFKRYNKSEALAKLEQEARDAKKGLWATNDPKAPWDFRKDTKAPEKPLKK